MPSGACIVEYRRKDGDITFRAKYRDAAGTQVQETLGRKSQGWTKRKAQVELRDRLNRVEKKSWRRPKPITLATFAPTWQDERARKRSLKPSSVRAYRNALDRLTAKLGHHPLGAINGRHLAQFVRVSLETLSPTTVNFDLSILADLYSTAMRDELVDRNPVSLVERPKAVVRHWRIFSPHEVPLVARQFTDERAALVFQTLVHTALRRHELQGLLWSDIDLIENTLRVRESKSESGRRTIAIPPTLAEAFWRYRRSASYSGDGDFVFAHPRLGNKLCADWYAREFRAACGRAGVEAPERPMHDVRHSTITNYAAETGNSFAVMTMAGHRTLASTRPYLHLAGLAFREEAAALEKRYGGNLYPPLYRPDPTSDDLSESEPLEEGASRRT